MCVRLVRRNQRKGLSSLHSVCEVGLSQFWRISILSRCSAGIRIEVNVFHHCSEHANALHHVGYHAMRMEHYMMASLHSSGTDSIKVRTLCIGMTQICIGMNTLFHCNGHTIAWNAVTNHLQVQHCTVMPSVCTG